MAARKEKHQTQTRSGTLAHIRINGELHRRHFKRGTPSLTIREWLLRTEIKYRRQGARRSGHFEDDARAYLEAVRAMPTFSERQRHIEEWIEVFGQRLRDTITGDEIRTQLHRWHTEPRDVTMTRRPTTKADKVRRLVLSESTVNKRRTALMHMYAVLDGKSAFNPVRDVPKFREPAPAPKAIPYALLKAMFAEMQPSKSKARLMVIAYTGIPHAQLQLLTPTDVDLEAATVAVAGRKKGRGTVARVMPLTPDGVAAFKLFKREDAWGKFARSTLRMMFRKAMAAVDPALAKTVTTYDLRHSFGTEVYRKSGDIRATQILMGHSTERLTHRYTLAAEDARVQAAIDAVAGRKSTTVVPKQTKSRGKAAKR